MKKILNNNINNKGITLVALVVTIVVLLILAGITITMLFSENGIIKKAQEAKDKTEGAQTNDLTGLNSLEEQMIDKVEKKSPIEKFAISEEFVTKEKEVLEDAYGNAVTVPKGFKVVAGSEGQKITVQNGVVIEDKNKNQFVWIPIGVVTKNDGSKSNEIKLGRYDFNDITKEITLKQDASNYMTDTSFNPVRWTRTPIKYDVNNKPAVVIEYATRDNNANGIRDKVNGTNAIAKNLKKFIENTNKNGGYYLARYEAGKSEEKLVSIKDVQNFGGDEIGASELSKNMYKEEDDVGVESDLSNSYAWDTALVYIQEMGNTDYAFNTAETGYNKNTGASGDVVCNIYDLCANTEELTTEYSTTAILPSPSATDPYVYPCISRGGLGTNAFERKTKISNEAQRGLIGFRVVLYIK